MFTAGLVEYADCRPGPGLAPQRDGKAASASIDNPFPVQGKMQPDQNKEEICTTGVKLVPDGAGRGNPAGGGEDAFRDHKAA